MVVATFAHAQMCSRTQPSQSSPMLASLPAIRLSKYLLGCLGPNEMIGGSDRMTVMSWLLPALLSLIVSRLFVCLCSCLCSSGNLPLRDSTKRYREFKIWSNQKYWRAEKIYIQKTWIQEHWIFVRPTDRSWAVLVSSKTQCEIWKRKIEMRKIGSFGLTGLNFKTDDKFRKWKREITWGNCLRRTTCREG